MQSWTVADRCYSYDDETFTKRDLLDHERATNAQGRPVRTPSEYQCGVLQVDIGLHNVLLDSNDNAKICDFAGSSIDGSPPNICPSHRAEHPSLPAENPSLLSELFALGSLLYELETGQQPYHEKDEEEIERLFEQDHFPNTDSLMLGNVITKCWERGYIDDEQVIVDLGLIKECLKHAVNMGQG